MNNASTPTMSLGPEGLRLIQDFETFQTRMYDTDGGGHCTIGWGHLVHKGRCDGRENEKVFLGGLAKDAGNDLLKKTPNSQKTPSTKSLLNLAFP